MKKLILYLWQLPQNLLGLLLIIICRAKRKHYYDIPCYICKLFHSGISLGQYIILDEIYLRLPYLDLIDVLKHENGHSKQSLRLGWLYLLVVGLPSIIRNIYDRIKHKKWSYTKRCKWYYGGYPENWADKLGEVKR